MQARCHEYLTTAFLAWLRADEADRLVLNRSTFPPASAVELAHLFPPGGVQCDPDLEGLFVREQRFLVEFYEYISQLVDAEDQADN